MRKKYLVAIIAFFLSATAISADCATPTPVTMMLPITPVQTTVAQGNAWISETRADIAIYSALTTSLPLTLSGYLTSVSDLNMPLRYIAGFQESLNSKIPILGSIFALFIMIIQWRFFVVIVKFVVENADNVRKLVLDMWGALPFT